MTWNPATSLGGLITSLSYKMRKQTMADLRNAGYGHISFPRFWVLKLLEDEPRNQSSLCEALDQKAPSMMEMLNRLHSDGLIKFKSNPNDPRKKIWSLTAKGSRDYKNAAEVVRGVGFKMDTFFENQGIRMKEIEQIKSVLLKLDTIHFQDY